MRTRTLPRALAVLTVAGAFSSVGMLAAQANPASSGASGPCAQLTVTGTWTVSQSNIPGVPFTFQLQQTGTAVTGMATYDTGSGPVTGTVSGTEQGNQFDVIITWSPSSAGHYTATVAPGAMTNGNTYDVNQPSSTATWSATGQTGCSVPTNKDECKNGGWNNLTTAQGTAFKNQGDCVSYIASAGKSDPHTS